MNANEARKILTPPLKFGDAAQIKAHEFLVKVEEAKDAVRGCRAKHNSRIDSVEDLLHCDCMDAWEDPDDDSIRDSAAREFIAEGGRR